MIPSFLTVLPCRLRYRLSFLQFKLFITLLTLRRRLRSWSWPSSKSTESDTRHKSRRITLRRCSNYRNHINWFRWTGLEEACEYFRNEWVQICLLFDSIKPSQHRFFRLQKSRYLSGRLSDVYRWKLHNFPPFSSYLSLSSDTLFNLRRGWFSF